MRVRNFALFCLRGSSVVSVFALLFVGTRLFQRGEVFETMVLFAFAVLIAIQALGVSARIASLGSIDDAVGKVMEKLKSL